MKFKWEDLENTNRQDCYGASVSGNCTYRAKVWGGWIVHHIVWQDNDQQEGGNTQSESMVFVADPNHEWIVE